MDTYEHLYNILFKLNQQHLLRFWHQLNDADKAAFAHQIDELELGEALEVFKRTLNPCLNHEQVHKEMRPIPSTQFEAEARIPSEKLDLYRRLGLEAISKGEVGVLLMAGGQGTRLGVDHPKGMHDLGLPSGKSLFQIQAERIRKVEELAAKEWGPHGRITWYIMTSGPTDLSTDQYLREHKFFGLRPDDVVQFKQGLLPCFSFNGDILLEAPNKISMAPDGNGGIYRALMRSGALNNMRTRGIKYVHAHSVDNVLVKVADPVFIGYCISKQSDCGAKVVAKATPNEPVGVVCELDGKFQVVEYSEISHEAANLRNENGELVFSAGNICNHFFTTDFLDLVCNEFETKLKLHVAKKKVPIVSEDGSTTVKPCQPNGIKIEKFVFDVFQFSERFVTWEVTRSSEFSAMKNSDTVGIDCPKTARQDLLALHKFYIEQAGGTVIDCDVEISPLLSYAGEDLADVVKGKEFRTTTVLRAPSERLSQNCIS